MQVPRARALRTREDAVMRGGQICGVVLHFVRYSWCSWLIFRVVVVVRSDDLKLTLKFCVQVVPRHIHGL